MIKQSTIMSNYSRRQDEALPPPPPYEPVANTINPARGNVNQQPSAGQYARPHQQTQYAPPSFPPPNHPIQAHHANQQNTSTFLNMMNANPTAYISSPTQSSSSNPFRAGSVAHHAQSISQSSTNNTTTSPTNARRQPSVKENQLEFLRSYDTIFIVDDSSSMNVNERPDGSMGKSRWEEARDALAGMVELAAKYDDDGVELHFLNSEECLVNCRDPNQIKALFDRIVPEGLTPTGTKLELLLLQYMDDIESFKQDRKGIAPKKRNYVIITDGTPTDDPESVIVAIASRLDRGNFPLTQVGIQFVQVGDDAEAREALEELDDALQTQHSCRDIVDTVPYSGMALNPDLLVKALLGGINRRLDRKASTTTPSLR